MKIDDLIITCAAINAADGIRREEIEEILVHALLINMCAEFEKILRA